LPDITPGYAPHPLVINKAISKSKMRLLAGKYLRRLELDGIVFDRSYWHDVC